MTRDDQGRDTASITIRRYRDEDLPVIQACIVELQDFERRIDSRLPPGESMAGGYLRQLLDRCRACEGRILIAEDASGNIAGYAAVLARVPFGDLDDPPGDFALLSDLYVRQSSRGHGIGRALVDASEQIAREAGATEMRVHVLSGNRGALALYRRCGFASYLETCRKPLSA